MSKGFIVFLVVLFILGVGFWLTKDYLFREQEGRVEFAKLQQYLAEDKPIVDFLTSVSVRDPGVYGDTKETTFKWGSEKEIISVKGFKLSATEAHSNNYSQAIKYFEENGFSLDNLNVADGATGGLVGYKKNNLLCIVEHQLTDLTTKPNEPIQANSDKQEIIISCGFLSGQNSSDVFESCANSRTCPAGFLCYNSQYSAPSPESRYKSITGPQEGDLLCHKLCETDTDCGIRKCLEKKLFNGDAVEIKKFCD